MNLSDTEQPHPSQAFVLVCRDRTNSQQARRELLDQHLDFVAANIDRYLVAGPLRAPQSCSPDDPILGSLFVVYAKDEDELHEFMSGDPYYASGIYQHTEAYAVTAAAGSAVGGTAWSPRTKTQTKKDER